MGVREAHDMSEHQPSGEHEGGDAPCWAHLFDDAAGGAGESLGADPLGPLPWRALLDQLADAVLISDADGTITYWNAAAERLFGWTAAEAVGAGLDLIIPERHRTRHWDGYRSTVASGTTKYGDQLLEVPALRRDGASLSIGFTLTLLTDPDDGRVVRLAAIVRDETARREERRRLTGELARLRAAGDAPSSEAARDGAIGA